MQDGSHKWGYDGFSMAFFFDWMALIHSHNDQSSHRESLDDDMDDMTWEIIWTVCTLDAHNWDWSRISLLYII